LVPSEQAVKKAVDAEEGIRNHTATDEHQVDHADYTPSHHPVDDDNQHHGLAFSITFMWDVGCRSKNMFYLNYIKHRYIVFL